MFDAYDFNKYSNNKENFITLTQIKQMKNNNKKERY